MRMMARLACLVAMALLASTDLAAAQKPNAQKPKNAQEQRDNARVREAKKDVDQARDKFNDAQKSLQSAAKEEAQAEGREKAAIKKIQAARDKAEERLGKSIGLDKALAEQKEAQLTYDKAKAPVVEALKKSPEYQAAVKKAAEAMDNLRALRTGGDSPEARKAKSAELTKQSLAPSQLEQKAITEDAAATAAHDKLSALLEKVSSLREKIRKDVDADAGVKSAKDEAEKARDALKKAQETLAKEKTDLARAKDQLAKRQADLQKAEIQDRQNDGKNKKK